MTPAVKFLLIANVAVFVVQTVIGVGLDYPAEPLSRPGAAFGSAIEFYLWQLFTYQFLHGGLFHLLFNMLALWMFGCDLERRWGSAVFSQILLRHGDRRRAS